MTGTPKELVSLIQDAMIKYGPDGHCDGAEAISSAVYGWMHELTHKMTALKNERYALHTLLCDVSAEYNLLDGVCMSSQCHHQQCEWRRSINLRVLDTI